MKMRRLVCSKEGVQIINKPNQKKKKKKKKKPITRIDCQVAFSVVRVMMKIVGYVKNLSSHISMN